MPKTWVRLLHFRGKHWLCILSCIQIGPRHWVTLHTLGSPRRYRRLGRGYYTSEGSTGSLEWMPSKWVSCFCNSTYLPLVQCKLCVESFQYQNVRLYWSLTVSREQRTAVLFPSGNKFWATVWNFSSVNAFRRPRRPRESSQLTFGLLWHVLKKTHMNSFWWQSSLTNLQRTTWFAMQSS
jgi:hypothetical protein